MKIKLVLAALSISFVALQGHASNANVDIQEASKEEKIGLGVGSVTGGILGGPIGLMVGAITGALVGDSVHSEKQINALASDLNESNENYFTLQKNHNEQEQALADAKSSIEKLLTQNQKLELETLEFAVQFRTNSSDIEKHYSDQLIRLAELLNQFSDIEISVDGFADRMGDETYNLELSGRRAAAVKEFLVQQGINQERILAHAHGESKPVKPNESLENNFFDRRVSISLKTRSVDSDSQLSVATN